MKIAKFLSIVKWLHKSWYIQFLEYCVSLSKELGISLHYYMQVSAAYIIKGIKPLCSTRCSTICIEFYPFCIKSIMIGICISKNTLKDGQYWPPVDREKEVGGKSGVRGGALFTVHCIYFKIAIIFKYKSNLKDWNKIHIAYNLAITHVQREVSKIMFIMVFF